MRRYLSLLLLLAPLLAVGTGRKPARVTYIYTYFDRNGNVVVNNIPPGQMADKNFSLKHVAVGSVRPAISASEFKSVLKSPELIAMVDEIANSEGVDPYLARAIIQAESAFYIQARSRAGALGLMQLMPATAQRFGVVNPFDPRQNITGGVKYLRWLLDHFKNDLEKVVAAYNAGEGAVARHKGIPPFAETRAYVPRVLGLFRNKSVQPDPRSAGAMALLKKGKGGFLVDETPVRNQVDAKLTQAPPARSSTKLFLWRDAQGVVNLTDYPPPPGFKEIKVDQD